MIMSKRKFKFNPGMMRKVRFAGFMLVFYLFLLSMVSYKMDMLRNNNNYKLPIPSPSDKSAGIRNINPYSFSQKFYQENVPATPAPTDSGPWGVATQIDAHTWTMKVGFDSRMATPKEILDALNNYRSIHGSGYLAWDDNLAAFAQERADYFNRIKSTDEHAGFNDYLNNPDNVRKLNFYTLGENSSYGFQLLGVHLIEWMYAGDSAHNDNQLNPAWTHVGIGVSGTATDLIFGK